MKLKIPPPLQALVIAFLMWGLDQLLPSANISIPGKMYFILVLVITGALIDLSAIYAFIRAKTTVNPLKPDTASALVNTGIFKLSRNPMYLGMLLLLTAWTIWLGNIMNIALLILFPLYITRFQIKPEEEALTGLFGEEFTQYCLNTRRWI